MLLQLAWTGQAAHVAAGVLAAHGKVQRAQRLDLAIKILAAAAVAGSIAFLIALPQGLATTAPTHTLLGFAVFTAAFAAFALDVVAAAAISAAERVVGGGSPHVLGTFIQFAYVVFAAPLLYRRLKRLVEAEPESSSLP